MEVVVDEKINRLQERVKKQAELVAVELEGTKQGYLQALGWVLSELDKAEEQTTETK